MKRPQYAAAMPRGLDSYQIAHQLHRTSGKPRPDPLAALPPDLRAEYRRAMEMLDEAAGEQQTAKARAYAFEVLDRIKRHRRAPG
ncbi:hypothetical protein [Rhodoblastus sp.]|uniref:hypothetical protein n=1 Tax=Rhodoblastus sp. TaxID=1962975 RepID=UPI002608865A|nr:hypothetical protein [Rhodoblastus sp.]